MIGFNRWLAQKDSFVASEMRIKVRYLSFTIDTDRLKLVWGAPEDLLRTFESKREVVLEQLVVAANRLSPPLSPHPLSPEKLELSFVPITADSEEAALESLTEFAKRRLAITATSQISQELESEYVGQYLDHFRRRFAILEP